jgi:hypothetical protein
MSLRALMRLSIFSTVALVVVTLSAIAETKSLIKDTRFCPSWAEAHERTLASLNNGPAAIPDALEGLYLAQEGHGRRSP